MNIANPKVDWFFDKDGQWKEAFAKLRELAMDSGLTDELKWGHPCYTLKGKNVFLMHGFNDYCALLFHKGALLKDDHGILVQQTANVQSARQIRFTSLKEIVKLAPVLRSYMQEAITVEKAGLKVALKETKEFDIPEEFAAKLKAMPALKKAFQALTPGRQRGYLLHFASAKQVKTREARIEKHIERILEGKGIDD
ncbi:MAG: YdeI/OmpD-associated family protein [Flavobacteriales bacterium]|nr:YdeI/OmpD-associated family protein [Flavobacteriales bacterium]